VTSERSSQRLASRRYFVRLLRGWRQIFENMHKTANLAEWYQQNERHEYRRDALLQQIERRRAGWAREVKRASEDIVDAEFKESTPNALGQPFK